MQEKTCKRCGETKPVSEFYNGKKNKDGYRNPCKKCLSVEYKIYNEKDYTPRTNRILRNLELVKTGFLECGDCGNVKSIDNFYIRPEYKTGYSPRCKTCCSIIENGRRNARSLDYSTVDSPKEKECGMCHTVKSSAYFRNDPTRSDKLNWCCRDCSSRISRIERRKKMNLPDVEYKVCKKCGNSKNVYDFRISKQSQDGCVSWCIDCERKNRKEQRDLFPDSRKMRHRKTRYGITQDEYDSMLKSQNGVCAICSKPETSRDSNGGSRALSVDHSHSSNLVRQLLCSSCNSGLGYFKDNPDLMEIAASYIRRHENQPDDFSI